MNPRPRERAFSAVKTGIKDMLERLKAVPDQQRTKKARVDEAERRSAQPSSTHRFIRHS
jgi:hypothetical protein